ncbi:MAG TPA: rhomboid family intramembrane serine protease [Flavobacterium sp.]|jgi:membrane associated rhomboid family serine protease
MNDNYFKFSLSVVAFPMVFVLLLWIVFWLETRWHIRLSEYGIYPRTLTGLRGVVFSPFLHGNLQHLFNNTVPLFVLIAALRYFYRAHFFQVLLFGIILSGLLTWIVGRPSYHIGASGLIYVLVSFIFFKGILTKYYRLVALSLIIVFIYGGLVWYVFPDVDDTISWEGHLSGLTTGFGFALWYKTPEYKKLLQYDWEKPEFNPVEDKFLQRFDENGNFVNLPPLSEEVTPGFETENDSFFISDPTVIYDYIEKNKNDNDLPKA